MIRISVYDDYGNKALGRMFDSIEKAIYYVEGVVDALEAWRDVYLNIETAEPIISRLSNGEMLTITERDKIDNVKEAYRIYMYDTDSHFQDPE